MSHIIRGVQYAVVTVKRERPRGAVTGGVWLSVSVGASDRVSDKNWFERPPSVFKTPRLVWYEDYEREIGPMSARQQRATKP